MNRYATAGLTALAGIAVLEVALAPGLVIGAAAFLAPKYLPKLRRSLQGMVGAKPRQPAAPSDPIAARAQAQAAAAPPRLEIKRAIAKTITFRIVVTTLDFTSNYVVIGELATAASLSAFALVGGPLLYLAHETAWNYFGPGEVVGVPLGAATERSPGQRGFRVSRALAKTVTFRVIATTIDFTATYVVVRDLATAAGLSAFGFVVGPFVYYGHEKAWDRFDAWRTKDRPAPIALLPAPSR